MNKVFLYLIPALLVVLTAGCDRNDEPDAPPTPEPTPGENVYDAFNRWAYSEMNRQYLWREDLPDSLECNYDLPPAEFFRSLRSDKDRFSYLTNNPYYSRASDSGTFSEGFEYQTVCDDSGREWMYVLYVYSDEARAKGIRRGDLLSRSGPATYSKAAVRNGKIIGVESKTIVLSPAFPGTDKSTVLLDSVYHIGGRKIGYICYLEYDDEEDIYDSLVKCRDAGVDELVLDLRYNPGGYVRTCRFICNCIVPASGYGGIFQQCEYNDILAREYLASTGSEMTYSYFDHPAPAGSEQLGVIPIVPLGLNRLFVLTSPHTASASEATIVCLRPFMEVVTIGETSVGKGVGSWTIYSREFPYALQPITMRYYNARMETTPDTGIAPDHFVADSYNVSALQLGDTQEPLLNKALSLIVPDFRTTAPGETRAEGMNAEIRLSAVGEPSFINTFKSKHHDF